MIVSWSPFPSESAFVFEALLQNCFLGGAVLSALCLQDDSYRDVRCIRAHPPPPHWTSPTQSHSKTETFKVVGWTHLPPLPIATGETLLRFILARLVISTLPSMSACSLVPNKYKNSRMLVLSLLFFFYTVQS